ncbi:hypothetical protein TNCV_554661 [Trichonephila clavipes]|nr:hypothetical protein TNCV_554661 [Trichonephila clavipes]
MCFAFKLLLGKKTRLSRTYDGCENKEHEEYTWTLQLKIKRSVCRNVTNSWLTCHEFEPSAAEDPPCRDSRCSRLKRLPAGVVWRLGDGVPTHVSSLTMIQNDEIRRQ